MEWTKSWLEQHGFESWYSWEDLRHHDLPNVRGVYVVVGNPSRPVFLDESVGGPHKRKALTVAVSTLEAASIESEVLYIGKANAGLGLRDRLWAFARQGRGHSAGHYGGRYLWQHPTSAELRVAWKATGQLDAGEAEEALLALFVAEYGARPFANLTGGHRYSADQARDYVSGWLEI
jgi:hypothetical protein